MAWDREACCFHLFSWLCSTIFEAFPLFLLQKCPSLSPDISSSKIRSRQSRCRRWRIMNNQTIQNCFKITPATKKLAENKLSALFATDIAIHVIYVDLGCFPSCRGSMTFPSWQASGAKLIRLITGVLSLAQSGPEWLSAISLGLLQIRSSGQAISRRIYEDMNIHELIILWVSASCSICSRAHSLRTSLWVNSDWQRQVWSQHGWSLLWLEGSRRYAKGPQGLWAIGGCH